MNFLLLRLKGPMQSWGSSSRFSLRDTGSFPSQSGIFGLIGSAMGFTRDSKELIELLAPLSVAVRIDNAGKRMRDYQIIDIGSGKKISERFYLSDANFLVSVYDPENKSDELLNQISKSLDYPENALFLGRKSCPPTEKINLGVHDFDNVQESLSGFGESLSFNNNESLQLNAWIPGNSGKHATLIQDVPLNFSTTNRSYSTRLISNIKILIDNPNKLSPIDPFDIFEKEV